MREMKPTFKSIAIYFLGLVIGIMAAILIVEKQLWFWHVMKDRDVLILEIRKINLERQEIDRFIQSLEEYMKEAEEILRIKVEK